MTKSIIVAVALDGAIGKSGALPWHLSSDLKHFKALTMGHPVIMGRKTFASIGRPLSGRTNIVLSHSLQDPPEGCLLVRSLEEAYKLAEESSDECFVIGGERVYCNALLYTDKLYLTIVHTRVPGADAFFPKIDPSLWREESRSPLMRECADGPEFEFVNYVKINTTV